MKLSVVMPIYNERATLRRAVESVSLGKSWYCDRTAVRR